MKTKWPFTLIIFPFIKPWFSAFNGQMQGKLPSTVSQKGKFLMFMSASTKSGHHSFSIIPSCPIPIEVTHKL